MSMRKVHLVFYDWMEETSGKSILGTEAGVDLSLGDFHSGTMFHATIKLEDYQGEIKAAAEVGVVPVFYLVTEESVPGEDSDQTGMAIAEELVALKQAIRAKNFDLALELVKANDAPFLWSKGGHWLGGA